jgi:uncharacterized protein HemX
MTVWICSLMTELAPRHYPKSDPVSQLAPLSRLSGQPILIAAVAFVVVVLGIGSIAMWRTYTGTAPETDRVVATRQLQARTAQASEQLVEKTKGIEATQQESIDQLQVVQDQLLTVRRLLAAQQADTRKLSEQVGTLTESIDGLRQSFASARATEPATEPSTRKRSVRKSHARAAKSAKLKRGRSNG